MSNSETPEKKKGLGGVVATVAAALGGPVLPAVFKWDFVECHPLWAVGLLLAYESVVFACTLVAGVWRRLEKPWLDAAAIAIDYHVQSFISRFRRKYLQHLYYQCRDFDVKGLTTQGKYALELERVFVELRVDATPPHEATSGAIPPLPDKLREGSHTVWDFLGGHRNLAIIGPPGCGKTTLLKHLALVPTLRGKHRGAKKAPPRLPFLLYLRRHAEAIQKDPKYSLESAIDKSEIIAKLKTPRPPGWFGRQLRGGRCLVLLDGLDEVAGDTARRAVVDWVETQMGAYPRNLFLLTSRPGGYRRNPLGGVHVLEVKLFNPAQVEQFVNNWYLANEVIAHGKEDPGVRDQAADGASELLGRLAGSETLTALAVNPLLLTMIATVHRYRSELPGRRVELYREICDVFLGKRHVTAGVKEEHELTPAQKNRVLRLLAWRLMVSGKREISSADAQAAMGDDLARVRPGLSAAEFCKLIEDSSGLLLEVEAGKWRFAHKTFQEYLAAVHCRETNLEDELIAHVGEEYWNETIRLYTAEADATAVLEACLRDDPPKVETLVLALECREEMQEAEEGVRDRLDEIVEKGVEDPERWRVCAEAMLHMRLRNLVALDEKRSVDPSLLTNAEYQLFLDQKSSDPRRFEPLHWKGPRFEPGAGKSALGGADQWLGDLCCEWLNERDGAGGRYRLITDAEAEVLADAETAVEGWFTASGRLVHAAPERIREIHAAIEQVEETDFGAILADDPARAIGAFRPAARAARDRARARNLARNLARARAPALAPALARALALALALALDLDLALDLAPARDLARDRARARARNLARDRDLARDLSPTRARARARDLARDRAHFADVMKKSRERARWIARSLAEKDRDILRNLLPQLTAAAAFIALVHLTLTREFYRKGYYRERRRSIAAWLIAPIEHLRALFEKRRSENPEVVLTRAIEVWLDVYRQMTLIDLWRDGKAPLVGGIRLLREHDADETSAGSSS